MPSSDKRLPNLRKLRLPHNSKEVAYVLKAWQERHKRHEKTRAADVRVRLEAAKARSRMPKLPDFPAPPAAVAEKAPGNAKEALLQWKRRLNPAYDALRYEIDEQRARLRSMKANRDRMFGTVGDPTLFDFLDLADSVSVITSPVATPGGSIFTFPPAPTTQNTPFVNQVTFSSALVSPLSYTGDFAWLEVSTMHIFSFVSPFAGSCTLTPAFQPNGIFTATTPSKVYFFPIWFAVPEADLNFSISVRADIFLPGASPTAAPSQSLTSLVFRPTTSFTGWNGPQTQSGGLSPNSPSSGLPGSITLAPFLVIPGAKVVISVNYFLSFVVSEGATGMFDAFSRPGLGLNVPFILARFDY